VSLNLIGPTLAALVAKLPPLLEGEGARGGVNAPHRRSQTSAPARRASALYNTGASPMPDQNRDWRTPTWRGEEAPLRTYNATCGVRVFSDTTGCQTCGQAWNTGDEPPPCPRFARPRFNAWRAFGLALVIAFSAAFYGGAFFLLQGAFK
jgi:hypothetical protein